MVTAKRVLNIIRYGIGERARDRKRAVKAQAREARFRSDQWTEKGDMARRKYASYDEYLAHQASKLERITERLHENEEEDFREFVSRFRSCAALAEVRSVLCLGARLGTEVKALHAAGHFAVGIDLNPGERNAYVLPGDFHHLVFPDGSIDAVYTNSLDHAFDLAKILGEVRRALRPGGIFIADILAGLKRASPQAPTRRHTGVARRR